MDSKLQKLAVNLRQKGLTYKEIQDQIGKIPKSTLSYWLRHIQTPTSYTQKIKLLNLKALKKGRLASIETKKKQKQELENLLTKNNLPLSKTINNTQIAKIALAILCLGEASKYNPKTRNSFYLGSSDHRIITIFLELLKKCYPFDPKKVRCTIQCRADQDTTKLTNFWHKTTNIPITQFYKPRIDPRTIGKSTKNPHYKGVLRVDYFDSKVRHDLENLTNLIYNNLTNGPVVHR